MQQRTKRLVLGCGLVAGMFTLAGCASAPTEQEQISGTQQAETVVFSQHYSDTGSLTVFESADGQLSVSVTGAIGGDDDQLGGAAVIQPTLVDTFKMLTGSSDSEVPSDLRALSVRHVRQQASALAHAKAAGDPAPPSVEDQAADGTPKDFYSQVCKTFVEGSDYYTPISCAYVNSCAIPNSGPACFVRVTGATMRAMDRSYAWNNTKWSALHGLMYAYINGSSPRTLTPYTWSWTQWGIIGTAYPYLSSSPNDAAGNIGVTVHYWSVVIL